MTEETNLFSQTSGSNTERSFTRRSSILEYLRRYCAHPFFDIAELSFLDRPVQLGSVVYVPTSYMNHIYQEQYEGPFDDYTFDADGASTVTR